MMRSYLPASARRRARLTWDECVVRLSGKLQLFKAGNPLGHGGAVKSVSGKPAIAVVDVVDGSGGFIGWGVFNPISMYHGCSRRGAGGHRDIEQLLQHRLRAAMERRARCGCRPTRTRRTASSTARATGSPG